MRFAETTVTAQAGDGETALAGRGGPRLPPRD
jgi:hypothetical protein